LPIGYGLSVATSQQQQQQKQQKQQQTVPAWIKNGNGFWNHINQWFLVLLYMLFFESYYPLVIFTRPFFMLTQNILWILNGSIILPYAYIVFHKLMPTRVLV
jgi:hypothetical protein